MSVAPREFSEHVSAYQRVLHDGIKLETIDQTLTDKLDAVSRSEFSIADRKSALDHAFREVLYTLIQAFYANQQAELDVVPIDRLVELAVRFAERERCNVLTPIHILNDALDYTTLKNNEAVFGLVEKRLATWKCEPFFNAAKNMLLRMCNELLRRLSKTQQTNYRGRIQVFLTHLFPLDEKSSLNLVSQFNLDAAVNYSAQFASGELNTNATEEELFEEGEIKPDLISGAPANGKHSASDADKSSLDSRPLGLGGPLHRHFWTLQEFFRNPLRIYERTGIRTFTQLANEVLSAFDSIKLDFVANVSADRRLCLTLAPLENLQKQSDDEMDSKSGACASGTTPSTRRTEPRGKANGDAPFFTTYLTNESLLSLQFVDVEFRRAILVQFAILFHFLQAPSRFRSAEQQLNDEQLSIIRRLNETVFKLLRETAPTVSRDPVSTTHRDGVASASSGKTDKRNSKRDRDRTGAESAGSKRDDTQGQSSSKRDRNARNESTNAKSSCASSTTLSGDDVVRIVQHILARESHWNGWKNDGCPSFIRAASDAIAATQAQGDSGAKTAGATTATTAKFGAASRPTRKRRRVGNVLVDRDGSKLIRLGNAELTRLWNIQPENMSACLPRNSAHLLQALSVDDFFEPAITQLSNANVAQNADGQTDSGAASAGETSASRTKTDTPHGEPLIRSATWQWLALRLLSRKSFEMFTTTNSPGRAIDDFLVSFMQKLAQNPNLQITKPAAVSHSLGDSAKVNGDTSKSLRGDGETDSSKASGSTKQDQLTAEQLAMVARRISDVWFEFGKKRLQFPEDDLQFFESSETDATARASRMLQIWTETDSETNTRTRLAQELTTHGLQEVATALTNFTAS